MNDKEQNRLKHRRQYLIAPESVELPFEGRVFPMTRDYFLYHHADLQVNVLQEDDVKIILLGDIFDFESPEKTNPDILKDLRCRDYGLFLEKITRYTGRYVLVYITDNQFNIVTDATATRKVYYCDQGGNAWIASQPHLLAKILGLSKTGQESKIKYYESDDYKRLTHANIGNTTYYDEIFQLIPNHYLDINQLKVNRFWPNDRIEFRPFDEVASECSRMVKGYMEAISSRYEVMLPVTAGKDTRLLLAGCKEIKGKVYYYINRNIGMSENNPDIRIPAKLFKKLKLDFHVIGIRPEVDSDFKKIYLYNNPLASEKYLPHIYNYYKDFSNRINLPGNFAAHPVGFKHIAKNNITPYSLANSYGLDDYKHAIEYYEEWLKGCQQLCMRFNVDLVRLFYWEERIANWGTQTQMEKDIAQEDINPLNSRLLLVKFFSVKKKYDDQPSYNFQKEIIKLLWPELLSVPLNPGLLTGIKKIMATLSLMGLYYKLKYKTAR